MRSPGPSARSAFSQRMDVTLGHIAWQCSHPKRWLLHSIQSCARARNEATCVRRSLGALEYTQGPCILLPPGTRARQEYRANLFRVETKLRHGAWSSPQLHDWRTPQDTELGALVPTTRRATLEYRAWECSLLLNSTVLLSGSEQGTTIAVHLRGTTPHLLRHSLGPTVVRKDRVGR